MEPLLAVVFGLLGGLARASRAHRLKMPSWDVGEDGERSLNLGFLGPLFIGAVAGLAAWIFNAPPAEAGIDWWSLGWALVAGVAGDIVLDYYTGQRYGAPATQERQDTGGVIDEMAATANTTANITSRELERAHEERRQALQRVAEQEAEIDRLKAEIERLKNNSATGD